MCVRVGGRLDAASAGAFANALRDAIAAADRAVILDCGGLDFISSTGIRALLDAAKNLHRRDARLVLCALSEPVSRVLTITCFDRMLEIHETEADARAALGV